MPSIPQSFSMAICSGNGIGVSLFSFWCMLLGCMCDHNAGNLTFTETWDWSMCDSNAPLAAVPLPFMKHFDISLAGGSRKHIDSLENDVMKQQFKLPLESLALSGVG